MGFEYLMEGQVHEGYWGTHTATIDWCEENYTVTPHVAEFVNTISNVPFVAFGLFGAWQVYKADLPRRYGVLFLGLAGIGVGSFLFHMQLKWAWQMWDELAMIYVIGLCHLLVWDTLPGWRPRWGAVGMVVLVTYDLIITAVYGYLGDPVFHQIAFALTQIVATFRTIHLIRSLPPTSVHPARGIISKIFFTGVAIFAAGFFLWNVDNLFCEQLREMRSFLGPLGVLLQLHAWWHLMTGYGSYLIMIGSTYLCVFLKTDASSYAIEFPIRDLPMLVKLIKPSPKAVSSPVEKRSMTAEEKTTRQYTPREKGDVSE